MRFARSRDKKFFSLLFASDQSKINRAYFRFVSPLKIFCFASFSFCFASFHFRFALDAKTSKKTLFSHRSEKNFTSVLLHFASKRKWWQFFASVSLHSTSERKWWQIFACVSLHFASKRKWWQFFTSFFVFFASFHFRFASDFDISHWCETSEKSFASFHLEAKMTAHPSPIWGWPPIQALHPLDPLHCSLLVEPVVVAQPAPPPGT